METQSATALLAQVCKKITTLPAFVRDNGLPLTPARLHRALMGPRLDLLRDIHRGRRAFVIGNGPSLTPQDLDRLRGEITFASNKIYLAFEHTAWRPTYYTVIDELVARNNRAAIRALPLTRIYSSEAAAQIGLDWPSYVVHSLPHPLGADGEPTLGFSDNLKRGAHGGYSVVYLGLQAAAHMGIREVYLLGVDFDFELGESTGEHLPMSGQVLVSGGERNHFDPAYRQPGELWTYPDLEKQARAFTLAREWFQAHGGALRNASRHTELDALPRVDLDQVLGAAR